MNDVTKQMEQFAEMIKNMVPATPVIKPSKNGYEIRTKVLEMAQNQTWQDFHAKWGAYESKIVRDPETGEIVTTVQMPEVPGSDAVLEAAEKFYEFVSGTKNK